MTHDNFNGTAETDVGYGKLLAVLLRRRFWVLGVFFTVLPVMTVISLLIKPTYESSLQLLVESNYQQKTETSKSEFADSNIQIDYSSQWVLMESSSLLQLVIDSLRREYPELNVKDFKKDLTLKRLTDPGDDKIGTKIFQATYRSNNPVKTQKVLAALQKVYQDYSLKQQKLRLSEGLSFIDEQLPEASKNVIEAEANLKKFRKEQNLIDPVQQAAAVSEALNGVEKEQKAVRTQYEEAQARYQALQQQVVNSHVNSQQNTINSSRLSESIRYQALLNKFQQTELELAQQRLRFTPTNPIVQKLLEQRQSQLVLLQEEAKRVLGEDSAQLNLTGEAPLTAGQLGAGDLSLTARILDTQTNLASLKERVQSLATTEQQLRAKLNQFPSLIAEYNRLQPEVKIKRDTFEQLLAARQRLGIELARGGFKWQVVEEPQLGKKIAPSLQKNLLMAVVLGLFLGGIAAFVREAFDDSVHTYDELKEQVALPLLGIIPELSQVVTNKNPFYLSVHKPHFLEASIRQMAEWQPFREALDLIYKNIQLLSPASGIKSLMVTSALAGEGKTTLAVGLALSATRLHQRVLLIDANLRCPMLHKQFNLINEQGLSTLLAGTTNLINISNVSLLDSNISILTAGPTSTDPLKLLSSPQMSRLMAEFEKTYDLILIDTSPIVGTADAIQTASFCQAVVIVGRIEQITQSELTQAIDMLNKFNVVGIVANGASDVNKKYIPYAEKNGHFSTQLKKTSAN